MKYGRCGNRDIRKGKRHKSMKVGKNSEKKIDRKARNSK
jgi:hypothetical protein